MKILFYDTETSGLVNREKPYHDESQPYMLQIGALLYDSDVDNVVSEYQAICDWGNIEIGQQAKDVHGISETVMGAGVNPFVAISVMLSMMGSAQECVGFNMDFDKIVLQAACFRNPRFLGDYDIAFDRPHFDIMKPLTNVCKIEGKYGKYKWPKLTEAYKILLGKELENAHDALADVRATFELWKYCKENDINPQLVL